MNAKHLPKANPSGIKVVAHAKMREAIKAKYVPRAPKDGEVLLLLDRPQVLIGNYGTGRGVFLEYAAGDYIKGFSSDAAYVVVTAKPGYTRSGEGWKRWEQIVVARPATDADVAAIADQIAAAEAESKRVLQAAMDR